MEQKTEKADEFFQARIRDLAASVEAQNYPRYSLFLDERQQRMAEAALRQCHCRDYCFFGGYDGAVRKILCVYPDYLSPEELEFPLRFLAFTYRKSDELTHRDFLGSLMALQLKRETIGDILVEAGQAAVIASETAAAHILDQVEKIGRVGVSVRLTERPCVEKKQEFRELAGTVASLRLDCVTALAAHASRTRAAELIRSGRVLVNYEEATASSLLLKPGDILTVRGFGKYILGDGIHETKKGRYHILLHQYQ